MRKPLIARVQQLLLSPKAAWAEIDGESVHVAELYRSYIAPLAAIPFVAGFIGLSLVVPYGPRPIFAGLGQLVVGYALTLASVYLLAMIFNYLAPQFDGQRNFDQALKVSAYAPTAAWVAGIFRILPGIDFLALLGWLYTLYLLFLGLPTLMKVPEEKEIIYILASIGAAMLIEAIIWIGIIRMF